MVSSLQKRETGDAASTALLFTDHQPVCMETPTRVQVEVEHCRDRRESKERGGREGGVDVRIEQRRRDRCIKK